MALNPIIKGLLNNVWTYVILAIVTLGAVSITYVTKYQAVLKELQTIKAQAYQNELAWQDSSTTHAAKQTELYAFIRNLQDSASKKNKEVVFWKNLYLNYVDSVHVSDTAHVIPTPSDSVGKYVSAEFGGKKGITTYKGLVKIYLTPLSKATYVLDLSYDPIRTASEFNRDKDGVFFIRTTSLTPGVNVIGYTALDSTAYPYLYRLNNKELLPKTYTVYAGGLVDNQTVALGMGIRTSRWLFLLNYRVYNKVDQTNYLWYNQVQIGVYHGLF